MHGGRTREPLRKRTGKAQRNAKEDVRSNGERFGKRTRGCRRNEKGKERGWARVVDGKADDERTWKTVGDVWGLGEADAWKQVGTYRKNTRIIGGNRKSESTKLRKALRRVGGNVREEATLGTDEGTQGTREEGAYHLHLKTRNSGWKIKRFVSFRWEHFVNYGPLVGVIHFLYSNHSFQFSYEMFMHEISNWMI